MEQEEREAKEAQLQAEEEAQVTAEKACLEEEERKQVRVREQVCQAEEAWAQAEEEAWRQEEERRVQEEEDHLVVERDFRKEGGPFSGESTAATAFPAVGSPEEEERVEGPSQDKGKG